MEDLEFGPVELVLAALPDDEPDRGVLDAIAALVEAGTVRLIDLLHIARDEDGRVTYLELDESGIDLGPLELAGAGLASHEDVQELGGSLPPGTSALLLVVEFLWAKDLASRLAQAGGFVVDWVRIPAPAVNAVVAEAAAVGKVG
ncbi:hypothetical protein GCM10022200_17300 [Microbacterium awajiense]|uniref:DUF1269 domain-containing protein n=1 Tax=Microbacterium awajiense TaxID=415214 RepID=A0ABP7AL84_9MICO